MSDHRPHMPVPVLTHNGSLIIAAAQAHPEIATRLTVAYITAAGILCAKLSTDVTGQKTAQGELGNLTTAQTHNLNLLHQCLAQAQKTAKRAFAGQTVKLHQAFQIGVHDKNDLGTFLGRCDIVLGAVKDAANLAAFKLKGWTDAETTAFSTARDGFGPAETYRVKAKSGAKDTTTQKNTDAALLYESILTIQNAADLEWPAADPAHAGVRDEFRLGIFPPDHGGNHPPTPPAPASPTPTTP